MTSIPKTYEGTEYVSHTVTPVPLRRSPTKRWEVVVQTATPKDVPELPFSGLFDMPVDFKPHQAKPLIKPFIAGMRKRWNKRTSTSDTWLDAVQSDLEKAINEG